MKKHMHAVGREKKAIQAANKEQRRRRKAIQREGQRLQLWSSLYPKEYTEAKILTRISLVDQKMAEDPAYAPYCMRCPGIRRMERRSHTIAQCSACGAIHDTRHLELQA